MTLIPDIPKELGCFGYFGFGGGWLKTAHPLLAGDEIYCNTCRLAQECWQRHRRRTRGMFPGLMELEDQLMSEGLKGPAFLKEYGKRLEEMGHGPANTHAPPEIFTNVGNIEDGMAVGLGHKPKDRDPYTITWPLIPLEPLTPGELG